MIDPCYQLNLFRQAQCNSFYTDNSDKFHLCTNTILGSSNLDQHVMKHSVFEEVYNPDPHTQKAKN